MQKILKPIILLILIGLLLRMPFLSSRPPTFDEAYNLALVQAETKTMIKGGIAGFEAPLYFLLLKLWLKMEPPPSQTRRFLFQRPIGVNIPYQKTNSSTSRTRGFLGTGINQGLAFSRFLSTLLGAAVILAFGLVGQKLFNAKVGIISSFLAAFSPVFIFESTNVKMYSLALLESLLMIYFFLNFLATKKTTSMLGLGLTFLLGFYTQYYFALAILVLNFFFLVNRRRYQSLLKKWFSFQILLFLFCLPLLWLLFNLPRPVFYPAIHSLLKIPGVFVIYAVSWDAIQILKLFPFRVFNLLNIPLFLLALGLLVAFLGGLKTLRFFFLLYIFLPIGLIFIISSLVHPFFSLRSFIIFSPAYYLAGALGIAGLKKKNLCLGIGVFLLVSSLFLAGQYLGFKATWESARPYRFVKENSLPGDLFVHSDLLIFLMARFYLGEASQLAVVPSWYPPETERAIGYHLTSIDQLAAKGNRLWYFSFETQYFKKNEAEEKERELAENYPKILDKEFKDQDLKISLFDLTKK